MKISRILFEGESGVATVYFRFDHPHRVNIHEASVDAARAAKWVSNGRATDTQDAIKKIIKLQADNGNDVRIKSAAIKGFTTGESIPDLDNTANIIGVCFSKAIDYSVIFGEDDTVMVKPRQFLDQTDNKLKYAGAKITPCCNPLEKASDCTYIDEICAIVHTPAVKAAYQERIKAERGPAQKTVKVMKPYQRIEMVDGKAVLKTGEKEVDEPVSEEIPVVCEQGKPVIGKDGKQLMHKVPVYE
tara:strand:+ start:1056 stop:1787 length:732 start_codon:yes stop_codon:yes gene_type:complete